MSDCTKKLKLFDHHQRLDQILKENDLNQDSICVVGSSCLAVRGIRSNNDIDIIINPEIKDQIKIDSGSIIEIRDNGYKHLGLTDSEVTTNPRLYDKIQQWKVIRPEIEYCHKKYKFDREDIELLEAFKSTAEDWDEQLVETYEPSRVDVLRNEWFWKKTRDSIAQNGIWSTIKKIPQAVLEMVRN